MNERQKITNGELWIGLAKVEQLRRGGTLGNADGAYTNAIAMAVGRANFRQRVKKALAELDLQLIRLENAETLKARIRKHSLDPELKQVVRDVTNTTSVGFGTFHAFDAE